MGAFSLDVARKARRHLACRRHSNDGRVRDRLALRQRQGSLEIRHGMVALALLIESGCSMPKKRLPATSGEPATVPRPERRADADQSTARPDGEIALRRRDRQNLAQIS